MSRKPYAPRPLRQADELSRLLRAIEVPDCDCPQSKLCLAGTSDYPAVCPGRERCRECPPALDTENPCPHVARVREIPFTVEEWAQLLLANDPAGYAEPAEPAPGVAVTKRARIALYSQRARRREALFSGRDLHARDLPEVAVQAALGKKESCVRRDGTQEVPCPEKS